MPNVETVRALINAFNVYNYGRNTVKTNFTLQSEGKNDYIVVSFEKSMDTCQCRRYLDSIKRKIIREFYGIEESNDAEILDTAKLIFDVNSFPFNISDRDWSWDEQNGYKFVTPIDQGVIFNLKSHLASSLKKDVLEDMRVSSTTIASNKKKYLWHDEFDNKESRQQFERGFLSRMRERYENVPKKPLKVEGNSVYIRDVFDDARFIDSVTRRVAWLEGMYLGVDSRTNHRVKLFKDMIIESIGQSTGVTIYDFVCASPLNRKEASILLPLVLDGGRKRTLTKEEALKLNYAFNYAVFNDLYGKTQGELSVNGSSGIYGIDFSNKEISHCVITKIIESSVINKDHELSIDPELHFRELLPSLLTPPPSLPGTPPNQSQERRDSGIGESPPKPKDYVAPSTSGGPGPSTKISHSQVSLPRQVSMLPHNLGAAQNVPARPSTWPQQTDHWLSQGTFRNKWQPLQFPGHEFSNLSWKGANPVGTKPWAQQTNPCLSPAPSAGLWSLPQSRPSSSKGADESVRTTWYVSSPLTTGNDPKSSSPKFSARSPDVEDVKSIFSVEPEKQQVTDDNHNKCSEAKPQESESPKKRRGGLLCKERWSTLTKFSPFKRRSVERDTMCSSKSDLVHHVTKKPPLPERSVSERKAKNNSPSKETSSVTEACTKNKPGATELKDGGFSNKPKIRALTSVYSTKLQKSLDPDQREELLKEWEIKKSSVKAQLPGERSSQASADSGLGKSLERGQSPSLIEKFNDKSLINSRVDSPNIKKYLQEGKEVFV